MCNLVRVFNFNFYMRVFAAFAAHAATFNSLVYVDRCNVFTTKMQVNRKAICRNQVQQRNQQNS